MGRGRLRRSMGCLAVLLVGGSVLGAAPAPAATPLYWSYPTVIDTAPIGHLSCPSVSFCVGADDAGSVLTSTDPTGGAGAWTIARIDNSTPKPPFNTDALSGVSCPSPPGSLCVAVGEDGIFASTDPTGGPGAWSSAGAVGAGSRGVSCPSTSLCVVSGGAFYGEILTSTEPSGGEGAWKSVKVDGNRPIGSISCPTTTLCVGIDGDGDVVTSTDPTGGAGAWTITPVGEVHSVSCPTASFCVAVGGSRAVTSTDPTGGAGTWTTQVQERPSGATFGQVACASPSLCIASGINSVVWETADPTGGEAAWGGNGGLDGNLGLIAAACPSESLCFLTDEALLIGVPTHRLSAAIEGEGNVESGALACPYGCTYSGSTCPRNCSGPSQAFIPQRLTGIFCRDSAQFGPANWGTCEFDFPAQNTVTLTPTPQPGWVFSGWSGACSGTSACSLPMSADRQVTAAFAPARAAAAALLPVLSDVHQTHARWREGRRLARTSTRAPSLGTDFSFTLNEPARVTFSFVRRLPGSMVGRTCAARRAARTRRCVRKIGSGSLVFSAHRGHNDIHFEGRLRGRGPLRAGDYTLDIAALANGGSAHGQLRFAIVR